MYLFFMISGFLFVIGISILLNYLYDLFSINKFTEFLSPTENTVFNKIGIVIIPNILWGLIEIILLGSNYYFILGFLLNIFVSMCIIYVVKFGYKLIVNKENNTVNIIAILCGTFFGFVINYLCLLIGINLNGKLIYSVIGICLFIVFYVFIRLFPPKSDFFRGTTQ